MLTLPFYQILIPLQTFFERRKKSPAKIFAEDFQQTHSFIGGQFFNALCDRMRDFCPTDSLKQRNRRQRQIQCKKEGKGKTVPNFFHCRHIDQLPALYHRYQRKYKQHQVQRQSAYTDGRQQLLNIPFLQKRSRLGAEGTDRNEQKIEHGPYRTDHRQRTDMHRHFKAQEACSRFDGIFYIFEIILSETFVRSAAPAQTLTAGVAEFLRLLIVKNRIFVETDLYFFQYNSPSLKYRCRYPTWNGNDARPNIPCKTYRKNPP